MKTYKKKEETKKVLVNSFIELMKEKPLSKISIQNITDHCHKNRNTFYYHFEDINAILKWTLEQDIVKIKEYSKSKNVLEVIKHTLDYVEQNHHILGCIYDSFGREQLKFFFFSYVNEMVLFLIESKEKRLLSPLNSKYKQFATAFISEAIGLSLISYLKSPNTYTRMEFEQFLSTMIENSTDSLFLAKEIK